MELEAVGLDRDEGQVWELLVAQPAMTAAEVGEAIGVPEARAAAVLQGLADRGLATHRLDDTTQFVAVRPSVALGGTLADRENELRTAAARVTRLDEVYASVHRGRQPVDLVDVVLGASAVAAAVEQIQLSARHEVLSLVKAPVRVIGSAGGNHGLEQCYRRVRQHLMPPFVAPLEVGPAAQHRHELPSGLYDGRGILGQ